MFTRCVLPAILGGFLMLGGSSAMALDWLHDQSPEGKGRICMTGHFHDGSSGVTPDKKIALVQAVQSWQSFTAAEYGDQWGNFRIAASQRAECTVFSGAWKCRVEARPCRKG
ncbi:MAG: hypothetical protein GC150_09020 [Rhizobiales bacterium]|nr:hypothetical protein [Hyphomicrobiales bacterium]